MSQLYELPKAADKYTFVYLEKARISVSGNSILVQDYEGSVLIPSALIHCFLIGPGVSITSRAIQLLTKSGSSVSWVGEEGTYFYCYGSGLTHSSRLLEKQAKIFSNPSLHLKTVQKMYSLRFEGENVKNTTLQQLRGKEGTRMKKIYQEMAERYGVIWNGRNYDKSNIYASDDINYVLSIANSCLYGLCHAVIGSLGLASGLGFVHIGHDKSFVYDIADLYKADISIPVAFEAVSQNDGTTDVAREVRTMMRQRMFNTGLIKRIISDLFYLLDENAVIKTEEYLQEVELWDKHTGSVQAGINYENI